MQKNRGRPRTGFNHKRISISFPSDFAIILRQVKKWDSSIIFSQEFVKAMRKVHKKLSQKKGSNTRISDAIRDSLE